MSRNKNAERLSEKAMRARGESKKYKKKRPDKVDREFAVISKLLLDGRDAREPFVGAEIGVFCGWMSKKTLQELPNCTLFLVDRWAPAPLGDTYLNTDDVMAWRTAVQYLDSYQMCLNSLDFAGSRAVYLKMELGEAATKVEDGSLDFIFLDADHSKAGTMRAWRLWEPKVKPGGVVAGHDWDKGKSRAFGIDVAAAIEECVDKDTVISVDRVTWAYRKKE